MIELISEERCIECNLCVQVCPTNVFDVDPGAPPAVARQEDCQTCFMCEAYCPTDAMFVAAETSPVPADGWQRDEHEVAARGFLGKYRHDLGWGPGERLSTTYEIPRILAVQHDLLTGAARAKLALLEQAEGRDRA